MTEVASWLQNHSHQKIDLIALTATFRALESKRDYNRADSVPNCAAQKGTTDYQLTQKDRSSV